MSEKNQHELLHFLIIYPIPLVGGFTYEDKLLGIHTKSCIHNKLNGNEDRGESFDILTNGRVAIL
ncbi:hypothetical protein O9G_003215 [Rozella allomycis CSF55]|uniref:Uncharacterized protein n=1 Tax=Rozella allomycis (strain CSF55) TaxID=988480 RepID=A0A075AY07_ROZAC|nr:hypothetical protein O9G_003215 [Rozella allomycis CSF55]|eukprot:EPZ35029.1 hypothetical protein O9G_003215 [Rozella allomycis CSF55]